MYFFNYYSPTFINNTKLSIIMCQYRTICNQFIFSSSFWFMIDHIIEWYLFINGYRTVFLPFWLNVRTQLLHTYLSQLTIAQSIKVAFYYIVKGMTGEIQIAFIPFFILSPSKGVSAGFIGFIEIEHMSIKTIYTITPCVF